MYCPNCGTQIPDNSKFCHQCGAFVAQFTRPAAEQAENDVPMPHDEVQGASVKTTGTMTAEKAAVEKKPIGKYIILGLIAFFIIIAALDFQTESEAPELTDEEKYEALVAAYHSGDYTTCLNYCEELGNYKNADKYSNLVKARQLHFSSDEAIAAHVKKLVQHMEFEDTKRVIMLNYYLAKPYLQGYWTSKDGMHTFEMRDNGSYITTVPCFPEQGDSYSIEDGIVYTNFKNTAKKSVEEYKITPISEDQLEIYSYRLQKTYALTKRR